MRTLRIFSVIVLAGFLLTGATCNHNRAAFNTLAGAEQGVKQAYDAYVDQVIAGTARTNELPVIAKSFDAFQASWALAVDRASGNTNAPVTSDISQMAGSVLGAIDKAKTAK